MPRKYDLVVFGGSGVTGQRVIAEVASAAGPESRTFAVAGRSEQKLRAVLDRLGVNAEVLVADVADEASLLAMARSAAVVLNCVGPFRYWGEPVVAACAAAGTHYLDICGEPDFMERMEFKYDAKAREAGCCIASAAGFDSVPADVGTLWTQRKFGPKGVPATVESYVTMHCKRRLRANFGTWESLVAGIANADSLRRLRKEVRAAGTRPPPPKTPGLKLKVSSKAEYKPLVAAYALPFPGADASVVKRTQAVLAARKEPATGYAAYLTVRTYWNVLLMYCFGAIVQQLCARSWGRKLLLRYPELFSNGIFTKADISEEDLASTTFSMTFVARGYKDAAAASSSLPDREIVTRVSGPEPAYKATAIIIVQSAMFLLSEASNLEPGVHTPAALLGSQGIVDRLSKHGIQFELVSDRQM